MEHPGGGEEIDGCGKRRGRHLIMRGGSPPLRKAKTNILEWKRNASKKSRVFQGQLDERRNNSYRQRSVPLLPRSLVYVVAGK